MYSSYMSPVSSTFCPSLLQFPSFPSDVQDAGGAYYFREKVAGMMKLHQSVVDESCAAGTVTHIYQQDVFVSIGVHKLLRHKCLTN